MSLQEAAFFYGDYSELVKEFDELDLGENSEGTIPQEEIFLT